MSAKSPSDVSVVELMASWITASSQSTTVERNFAKYDLHISTGLVRASFDAYCGKGSRRSPWRRASSPCGVLVRHAMVGVLRRSYFE